MYTKTCGYGRLCWELFFLVISPAMLLLLYLASRAEVYFTTSGHNPPPEELYNSNATLLRYPLETSSAIRNITLEVSSDYTAPQCQPEKSIYFLRIPKTGTTTLTNIMYRFISRDKLTMPYLSNEIVFPNAYVSRKDLKMRNYYGLRPPYHYFGEHMVYNETEVRRLLYPGAVHISSIRYPLTQLRSTFVEWNLAKQFRISSDDPLEEYLEHYFKYAFKESYKTRSPMTRFFGVSEREFKHVDAIQRMLRTADEAFKLVMVMEYFDESLVLLRRLLCWDVRDIIYVPQRLGHYSHPPNLLRWALERVHQTYDPGEYAIYNHFTERLFSAIRKEPHFQNELERFRAIKQRVFAFCLPIYERVQTDPDEVYVIAEEPPLTIDPSPFGNVFNVSGIDCLVMNLHTVLYRYIMLIRHDPEACNTRFADDDPYFICTKRHPVHDLPLKALASRISYVDFVEN